MTQSVGVPSICQAPSGRRAGRSGRCSVSECEVPLCSRSGATTVTFPTSRQTSASSASPGARMPSSLVTRMFMGGKIAGQRGRRAAGRALRPPCDLPAAPPPRPVLRRGSARCGTGRPSRIAMHRLQLRPRLRRHLRLERLPRAGPQLAGAAVLVDPLARAVDGELLGVEQVLHQHDQLHFPALVHPVARPVLGRVEEAELALPVAQHVRLEIGQRADLADRVELLDRLGSGHRHCSDLSSRVISSATPRAAACRERARHRPAA